MSCKRSLLSFLLVAVCIFFSACEHETPEEQIERLLKTQNHAEAYVLVMNRINGQTDLVEKMKTANEYARRFKASGIPTHSSLLYSLAQQTAERVIASNPEDSDIRSLAEMISLKSRLELSKIPHVIESVSP
jgi:thiamine biosynthesis lipoprotein ApbE